MSCCHREGRIHNESRSVIFPASSDPLLNFQRKMEFKLRAISNNVDDNDTMTFHSDKLKNHQSETEERGEVEQICDQNVPVLYSTLNGIHLRKYVKTSRTSKYQSSFCDLERWVRQDLIKLE